MPTPTANELTRGTVAVVVLTEVAGDQQAEAAVKAVSEALHAAADRRQNNLAVSAVSSEVPDGALLTWMPDGQRRVVDVRSVQDAEHRLMPVLNEESLRLVSRCRYAQQHNGGHPIPAWSTGEQLAVALVLKDKATLDAMGYTQQEAANRLAAEMWTPHTGEEFMRWLKALRVELAFPGFVTGDPSKVR